MPTPRPDDNPSPVTRVGESAGISANSSEVSRPDSASFPSGQYDSVAPPKIEGYEVLSQIGAGGMGTVWRAIQRSTHRDVALKIMSSYAFGSSRGRARFEREIEITAKLEHPNIARVYEGGFANDTFYYAMQLIDGVTLDAYVVKTGREVRDLAELMRRICVAVAHAHQKGVIHRDLKPSNILVTPDGQPHVVDFGLAKAVYEVAAAAHVTVEGEVAGTPSYMSPEQASGRSDRLDTRSDVYSLGVILFNLLTGEFPHDVSGSFLEIMRRVSEEEPKRLRAVLPGADPEMEAILTKALGREPEDRYATASELGDDLQRYLRLEPLLAQPPTLTYLFLKNLRRHRAAVLAGAAIVLLLLGAGVWAYLGVSVERSVAVGAKIDADQQRMVAERQKREADQAREMAQIEQRRAEELRLSAESSLADRLISEADARGAEWRWEEARALLLQAEPLFKKLGRSPIPIQLRLWQSYRLTPPALVKLDRASTSAVAISKDGRRAATGHLDGRIAVWDVPRQEVIKTISLEQIPVPMTLAKVDPYAINGLAMSGDGKLLLAGSQDLRLALWDLEQGTIRFKLPGHMNKIHAVAMSSDGTLGISGGWGAEVHAWDLKSGKELWSYPFFKSGQNSVRAVGFTSDTKYAIVLYGGMGLMVYDARTGEKIARILNVSGRAMMCLATGPDPDLIAVGDHLGGISLFSIKDQGIKNVFAGHRTRATRVAFSPDGTRLISSGQDGLIRVTELATGRLVRALPGLENEAQDMAVSGDGRFVVLSHAAGTVVRTITPPAVDVTVPHPDGRNRVFSAEISQRQRMVATAGGAVIRVFDLATGKVLAEADASFYRGKWSTESIHLRFSEDESAVIWGDDRNIGVLTLSTGVVALTPIASLGAVVGMDRTADNVLLNDFRKLLVVDRKSLAIRQALACFPDNEKDVRGVYHAEFLSPKKILAIIDATQFRQIAPFPRWTEQQYQRLITWDAGSGKQLGSVLMKDATAYSTDVFPGGDRVLLAIGSSAGVWELGHFKQILSLHTKGGGVVGARLTHQGNTAITADASDDTLRFWDANTGAHLATLDNAGLTSPTVACTADGRFIVLVGRSLGDKPVAIARDLHRYLEMAASERKLRPAGKSSLGGTTRPDQLESLADRGHWYALNGVHDWAAPLLASAGNAKPSLELARELWMSGKWQEPATEFDRLIAEANSDADRAYLRLCAAAARRVQNEGVNN